MGHSLRSTLTQGNRMVVVVAGVSGFATLGGCEVLGRGGRRPFAPSRTVLELVDLEGDAATNRSCRPISAPEPRDPNEKVKIP